MVTALESTRNREAEIRRWIELIWGASHRTAVKAAVNRISEILLREFPSSHFDSNLTEGLLESQLPEKVREGSAMVVAFVEKQAIDQSLWSWTIHLVETAGVAAKIDTMVAAVRTRGSSTMKAREVFKPPLHIPPFGAVSHTWQFLCKPWEDCRIRLSFSGYSYSYGEPRGMVVVHCPEQCPG